MSKIIHPNIVYRYPSKDDLIMTDVKNDIKEINVPFNINYDGSIDKIKSNTKHYFDALNITLGCRSGKNPSLEEYKKLASLFIKKPPKDINILLKPLQTILESIQFYFKFTYQEKDFYIMTPSPPEGLISIDNYLRGNSYGRHHLVDGIHGFLRYGGEPHKVQEWGFNDKNCYDTNNTWKGLFITDIGHLKYIESDEKFAGTEATFVGTFEDNEGSFGSNAISSEYDLFRIKSSEYMKSIVDESDYIKIYGNTNYKDSKKKGDSPINEYKILFNKLYDKIKPDLLVTNLGVLMNGVENRFEVDITGLGKITIKHFENTPSIFCNIDHKIVIDNITLFIDLCMDKGILDGDRNRHIDLFVKSILEEKSLFQLGGLVFDDTKHDNYKKLCNQYYPRLLDYLYNTLSSKGYKKLHKKKKRHKKKKTKKKKYHKKKRSKKKSKKKSKKNKYLTIQH